MKKTFYIKGMHCVSCEILLKKEVEKISKFKKIEVSHKKGILEIEGENIPDQEIKKAINQCGYSIVQDKKDITNSVKISKKDFLQIVIIFLIGLFIIQLFSRFEITRFFPNINENISFAIALLLGLIASVSTCLALTGGIVMSFSSQYNPNTQSFFEKSLPQIYFHIWRIGGFFILGGLLGLLGKSINYSISFTGYISIFVAFIMLYIGLQILNIVPNITKFGFHLPKKWSNKINSLQENNHPFIPAIIGALTFFLPCGFTQSMQLVAVASGNFWTGGFIMAFFALGTLPVLFLIGIGTSYSQKKDFGIFKKIVGVIIVFFALYSFQSGLRLIGSNITLDFWNNKSAIESNINKQNTIQNTDKNLINTDIQTITMNIDYTFEPSVFKIKKDIPVRFIINANRVGGCTNEVIIPSLNLSTGKLKNWDTAILEFTPNKTEIIPFSCWMGMEGGKIIVE